MIYLKYLKSLLLHKWYVFRAGLFVGVPLWQLIIHDWQKFTPFEFGRYARKFMGDYAKRNAVDVAIEVEFADAWLHHENTGKHHWGYWIPRSGRFAGRPLPMPSKYIREMVADWMGASKAYTGSWDISEWLNKNLAGFNINVGTSAGIHSVLIDCGFYISDKEGKIWESCTKFKSWARELKNR